MLKKNVTLKDNVPYKNGFNFSFLNVIFSSAMEIVFETYYKKTDLEKIPWH